MRAAAARQDGFTLIEALVAMAILVTGLLSTFVALNASSHLTLTTQREQAAMTAAEQQMEQLRAMTYANLALSYAPSHSADGNAATDTSGNPSNPDYWVSSSASNLLIPSNFNSESSGTLSGVPSSGEPFVTSSGGVSPGPVTVSSDGFTATVYRFITWEKESCIDIATITGLCTLFNASEDALLNEDAKRITVAVVIGSGGNGVSKPVWLTTLVGDPQAGLDL